MGKAVANFGTAKSGMDTTNDNIVIVNCAGTVVGGRTLDVSNWPHSTIPGGHPVIKDDDGEYKPIPIDGDGVIDTTKAAKTKGVLVNTILKEKPLAAIMNHGVVNHKAAVYTIPQECMTALKLIQFTSDND